MNTDSDLYGRWLAGRDEGAFAELARRHADLVFDVAWRTGGDRHVAEDSLQEALLRLASEGSDRPLRVGVRAWLARLAISKARNARASARARTKRERTVGSRRSEARMTDERAVAQEAVAEALARGDRDDAALLSMRYIHGLEYPELAAVLNVAEATARVRVHRALGRLRETTHRDDLDDKALAGLVAAVPSQVASAVSVESAISAAVAGSIEAGAATLLAASWIPRALAVAGVVVVMGGASLLWWRSDRARPAEPTRSDSHAPDSARETPTTLRGRLPVRTAKASEAASPTSPPAVPVPAPEKAPPDRGTAPGPAAADVTVPLRARLLLVLADGTEEALPISEIMHRGNIWSGEALDLEAAAIRVLPGKSIVLGTPDDRAAFPRIVALVPESPSELVVRIPAKGSRDFDRLTLEVVDRATGLPIPDAWLEWGIGEGRSLRVLADRRGRIRVRIPPGASWVSDGTPALHRFSSAERVVHAPGYFAFGEPRGAREYVPAVSADDLATWLESGVQRIALEPIPEEAGYTQRAVVLLDAEGRPAEGAYVLVYPHVDWELPWTRWRWHDGFRRADEEGRISFPVDQVVGLEVRVDRVPIAAWGLHEEGWPDDGPRVLRLPAIAEAELAIEGLPEGVGYWTRDPLGAKRTPRDGPSFPAVHDPEAQALLERTSVALPFPIADMARGELASPRSTLRLPLPVGRTFTLHLWMGNDHRTWTIQAEAPGPFRLVGAWEDLPKAR